MGEPTTLNWLLNGIKNKTVDPKKLSVHQRKILVRYFLTEHMEMSYRQIAEICGTSHTWITRYRQSMLQQDGWVVDQLDVRAYAVHLIQSTKWTVLALRKKGEAEKAQKIEFQLAQTLMEMGYLPKAPIQLKYATGMTLWDILAESQKAPKDIDAKLIGHEEEITDEGRSGSVLEKVLDRPAECAEETAGD